MVHCGDRCHLRSTRPILCPRTERRPKVHGADWPADQEAAQLEQALFEVKKVIVGQDRAIERLLVCLLARGHCLLEGVPGLAKTLAVETLATVVGGTFTRLQFTPDLLPADIVGTRIYRASSEKFDVELGPVFANFVLADEINRAPAKVQSALLEVMAEHHVSIGGETFPAPEPFLVLATQNPIESEGVYPLPEAQRDRFLMKIVVGYPTGAEEVEIVHRMGVTPPRAERGARPRRARRRCRPRPTASTSTTASSTTPSTSCSPPATRRRTASPSSTRSSRTAPAPAPASASSPPAAPSPCCGAAPTPCPRTCSTSPPTSCATASCCPTRRWPDEHLAPTTCSARVARRPCPRPASLRPRTAQPVATMSATG